MQTTQRMTGNLEKKKKEKRPSKLKLQLLEVQSGKVSGKIPMLLFHCPEQHIYTHTDAAFISNILQLLLKSHCNHLPQTALMWQLVSFTSAE